MPDHPLSDPPVFHYGKTFILRGSKEATVENIEDLNKDLNELLFNDPDVSGKISALLVKHNVVLMEPHAVGVKWLDQKPATKKKPAMIIVKKVGL